MSKELEDKLSELKEKLQSVLDEKDALVEKNKQLIKEKRAVQSKINDNVDIDEYNKLVDELETVKSNYSKLEKESKSNLEKLTSDLTNKDAYLQKMVIDENLTKTLLELGVDKQFIKPALAMLKPNSKIKQGENGYEAVIEDAPLSDYISKWYNEGDGKVFQVSIPNSGGGSNGGTSTTTTTEQPKTLSETYKEMFPN